MDKLTYNFEPYNDIAYLTLSLFKWIVNWFLFLVLGNGCVVHIEQLLEEIQQAEKTGLENWQNRLLISNRAHIGRWICIFSSSNCI